MDNRELKLRRLKKILTCLQKVVVAYSGGLDSTFLLKAAIDTLGRENVLAVTARSETYPVSEYREAIRIAKKVRAMHVTIKTNELGLKSFKSNPVNRCYYCKKELFKKLDDIKDRYGLKHVLDGTNYDDLKDIRYGRKAAKEQKVKSPLLEARVTKADIRVFSKRLGLPTWDKPSFACLASRIPFNTPIEDRDLMRIQQAEECLRRLGFKQVRVRQHSDIARIEVYECDFQKILNNRIKKGILNKLKSLGYKYITLDLGGYRTGSMH